MRRSASYIKYSWLGRLTMKSFPAAVFLLLVSRTDVDAFQVTRCAVRAAKGVSQLNSIVVPPSASSKRLFQQPSDQAVATVTTTTVRERLLYWNFDFRKGTDALQSGCQNLTQQCQAYFAEFQRILASSWWMLPMTMCLVPLVCKLALNVEASTPHFWKLVDLNFVHGLPHSAVTLSAFLASNIAYFASGLYLLIKSTSQAFKTTTMGRLTTISRLLPPLTKTSALGYWVLAAGIMSTIFHTVQALGDYAVAESWCYLDHGVACSAILYFYKICGPPARGAMSLGVPGLLCLIVTPPQSYAWLHSAWHFFSASAAVAWALQGTKDQQRNKLESTFLLEGVRQRVGPRNEIIIMTKKLS